MACSYVCYHFDSCTQSEAHFMKILLEAKLPSAELENDKLYIIVEKSFISSVEYIKKASTFDIIVCFNKIT